MGAQVVGARGTAEGYRGCPYLDHRLAKVDLGMARRMMQRH